METLNPICSPVQASDVPSTPLPPATLPKGPYELPPGPLRPSAAAYPTPRYRVLRNWALTIVSGFFLCAFGGLVTALELAWSGEWLPMLPAAVLSLFGVAGLVWERKMN